MRPGAGSIPLGPRIEVPHLAHLELGVARVVLTMPHPWTWALESPLGRVLAPLRRADERSVPCAAEPGKAAHAVLLELSEDVNTIGLSWEVRERGPAYLRVRDARGWLIADQEVWGAALGALMSRHQVGVSVSVSELAGLDREARHRLQG